MEWYIIALTLTFSCAFSQNFHELHYDVGCFYNGTVEVMYELDGDSIMYADFENNEMVFTLPPYIHIDLSPLESSEHIFVNAMKAKTACKVVQTLAKDFLKDVEGPEVQDPPESILYPADDVYKGEENSLICFVNRFFPPRVKITWTKNNRPVSEGVSVSLYMPNNDQTFHCFSTLKFIPVHGDVYSCTVEHLALDTPKTRIWDVDLHSPQDLALDVYCGVGLTVAFVGVAIGTFLIARTCSRHSVIESQ